MSWDEPSAEQLRAILERATDLPADAVERAVKSFCVPRLVRWAETDRELARRVLARQSRPSHNRVLPGTSGYPASSGQRLAGESLGGSAVALLGRAAAGEPVDDAELGAFARAALASTELGRLALGVLEGGPHAPRRALELARLVAAEAVAGSAARKKRDEVGG